MELLVWRSRINVNKMYAIATMATYVHEDCKTYVTEEITHLTDYT